MEEEASNQELLSEVKTLRAEVDRLRRAREGLDDFTYIVSHDFNAPLRGMNTLVSWLARDHAHQMDAEGQKVLSLLAQRILKLVNMVEAILQFSRIGRVKEAEENVDLSALVTEVFTELDSPPTVLLEQQGALPVLRCERQRMHDLFYALMDNAVYYLGGSKGCIRVGGEAEGNRWKFWMADTGPGISSRHFERIFKMFQALEVHEDPRRVGAGLALARKFVEQQGGMIWVESTVGQGATFYFTWPDERSSAA